MICSKAKSKNGFHRNALADFGTANRICLSICTASRICLSSENQRYISFTSIRFAIIVEMLCTDTDHYVNTLSTIKKGKKSKMKFIHFWNYAASIVMTYKSVSKRSRTFITVITQIRSFSLNFGTFKKNLETIKYSLERSLQNE